MKEKSKRLVCVNLSPAGGVLVLVKQQNLYRSDFELNCCKLLAFLSFTLLKTTQRLQSGVRLTWRFSQSGRFVLYSLRKVER